MSRALFSRNPDLKRLRDEGYTKAELTRWAGTVRELGKGWSDAFVFFKHEEAGIGAKLAVEFGGILAGH